MNPGVWRTVSVTVASFLPFTMLVGYYAVRTNVPFTVQDAAPPGHDAANVDGMIDTFRSRLARQPDDADGWVLLGRSLVSQARWAEARQAFTRASALHPENLDLHLQLGEALTLEAGGRVTPEAAAEFAHAPDDPRARFYAARALAQAGNVALARERLLALQAEAPPEARWRSLVQNEIAALDTAQQHPVSPKPSDPAPAFETPLQALEDHIRSDPHDVEIWLALANAYANSGDLAAARTTLARANQTVPGNLDLLLAFADRLADGIKGETLPADFLDTLQKIQAIDPDQPDALWYLGLAARQKGDVRTAAADWKRLLDEVPAGSDEHAALQQRLKSLQ